MIHLGTVAVMAKLLLGASVAWAVRRRVPWFRYAAVILVGWWGFGAWVNSL